MNVYPLKFDPIFKERIWGGDRLATYLNKDFKEKNIGESWEISTVENDISVIANGYYKGRKLTELIAEFPSEVLGTDVFDRFGKTFPLLFKFLDAKDDLSIQVHPSDELAKERHNSFGKTEMWYIIQADSGSRIIVGFRQNSSAKEYIENLQNKTLVTLLNETRVEAGDAFLLDTGTVHAIGGGIILAEIQQTSDITYRVYDWDRVDENGKSRELHIDLALEAINYEKTDSKRLYQRDPNKHNTVVDCPYFTTNFIPLEGAIEIKQNKKSFRVYMCVEGNFMIDTGLVSYEYKKGDSLLIPASMLNFFIKGNASILEIYIS